MTKKDFNKKKRLNKKRRVVKVKSPETFRHVLRIKNLKTLDEKQDQAIKDLVNSL